MELNDRVKQAGITKKKLAQKMGVSVVQLSYWLNGTRSMPEDRVAQLKAILAKAEQALG